MVWLAVDVQWWCILRYGDTVRDGELECDELAVSNGFPFSLLYDCLALHVSKAGRSLVGTLCGAKEQDRNLDFLIKYRQYKEALFTIT